MVDRTRAAVIARRAADGIPRTQPPPAEAEPVVEMVRISARIPAAGRDALRRLAAAHGLSVASLVEVLAAAADEDDAALVAVVDVRADRHRRPWGGPR